VYETPSAEWIEYLASVIGAGVTTGEFHLTQSPRDTAIALPALIDGLAVHVRVTRHISIEDAKRVLRQQCDALQVDARPARPRRPKKPKPAPPMAAETPDGAPG